MVIVDKTPEKPVMMVILIIMMVVVINVWLKVGGSVQQLVKNVNARKVSIIQMEFVQDVPKLVRHVMDL